VKRIAAGDGDDVCRRDSIVRLTRRRLVQVDALDV
jgi:hypothetical protein